MIVVHLAADAQRLHVIVEYHLEVDTFTVVLDDLPAFSDKVDLAALKKPDDFYQAFTDCYGPVLAENLVATLDGRALHFAVDSKRHTLVAPDNNLRCDFVFRAEALLGGNERHNFRFRETNYELEEGRIRLTLAQDPGVRVLEKEEPDAASQEKDPAMLRPGEDAKLRELTATWEYDPLAGRSEGGTPSAPPAASRAADDSGALLNLLFQRDQTLWWLLILAAFLGAGHALTPGHGKTLVAAYLVGERGTVWHAILLGVVTTLTHTGAVLVVAGVLPFLPFLQKTLGILAGVLIVLLGFWTLLRRLSGRADHVHVGGGHHHHHHHGHDHAHVPGDADHNHDEHEHTHSPNDGNWWRLIVLGISGGIVPCVDAIALLLAAVRLQILTLALPLLLAFSAGLASVLIVIGIAVVRAKGVVSSRWGGERWVKLLPIVSAVLVTALGLWMCYDSLHGGALDLRPRP